jgi:phosphatidylserine/phosphatidylglycerophosphate/cardiolipin synthase-like enzyme
MVAAMVALSSTGEALAALGRARQIDVRAYTLHGPVLRAVEAAVRRGAEVSVHLADRPYKDAKGHLESENQRLANELRAQGATVSLEHLLHAKTLAIDGTLFLDGKNWWPGDLVLRDDDSADAVTIPTIKDQALAQEDRLLAGALLADDAIVESESFGAHNVVYSDLEKLALGGAAPRLLVSEDDLRADPREHQVIERLVEDGVRVRVCRDSEKLAVAGDGAWLGSANATMAAPIADSTDWGLCTNDSQIVAAVRARLEAQWQNAKAFKYRTA